MTSQDSHNQYELELCDVCTLMTNHLDGICVKHRVKAFTDSHNPTLDEPDTEFSKQFKKLKQLRNSHQIDEPEFDERVEQLAADTYAHPLQPGWCCACEADQAFLESSIANEVVKELEAIQGLWHESVTNSKEQIINYVEHRISELRKERDD